MEPQNNSGNVLRKDLAWKCTLWTPEATQKIWHLANNYYAHYDDTHKMSPIIRVFEIIALKAKHGHLSFIAYEILVWLY